MPNIAALPKAAWAAVERAERASQASWAVSETTDDGFCVPGVAYLMGVDAEANAEFIAHAREDIPILAGLLAEALDTVAERERAVASLRQSLTVMQPEYEWVKAERDEGRAKLEAARELRDKLWLAGPIPGSCCEATIKALDAILGGNRE